VISVQLKCGCYTACLCVRNMSQGVAGFFGIPGEDRAEEHRRQNEWKERSRRMHSGSMFLRGHKLPRDQIDTPAAASVVRCFIQSIEMMS